MTEKAEAFIENLTKDPKTMQVAMEFGQKALAFGAEKSDFIREKVLPLAKNMGIDLSEKDFDDDNDDKQDALGGIMNGLGGLFGK